MGVVIGIDLGTTNSLAAVFRNGHYELVPNAFGEFMTPSVVSVDENNTIYVGKTAKERLITHPQQTVSVFKRSMGTTKKWLLGGKSYSPEELSALVLKRLKEDAEKYLGEPVEEAVVSVPAYFGDNARMATREAGRLAGMKVDRIVNEPSAAALACMYTEDTNEAKYLVFDFGGGTLDVSLVDYFENIVQIQAVSGNRNLGGTDFDRAIARAFCKQQKWTFDSMDEGRKQLVLKAAERVKMEMSSQEEADMVVTTEHGQYTMHLTRNELAKIIGPGLAKLAEPINRVLKDGGIMIGQVDTVILVGGSSKMPLVQQYLKFMMPKAHFQIMNPDQVIAIGAGIFAGILSREAEIKDLILTDICPFSLGTAVHNEADKEKRYMDVIIPRNTALPVSRRSEYTPVSKNAKEMRFQIYQGEELYVNENVKLGEIMIPVPVGLGENRGVEATYTYDINGLLHVKLKAKGTGEEREATFYHGEITDDKAMIAKAKELAQLTLSAVEDEENQLLLERAKAIYTQVDARVKEGLKVLISLFEQNLNKGDEYGIAKSRKVLLSAVEKLEEEYVSVTVEEQDMNDFLAFLDNTENTDEYWESVSDPTAESDN